mmetsp:Transcript_8337/g.11664  ORF Transcript_8337/g.11664 Transcript_8337/m.11664 type:complete len:348 (+) Transcript_8337:1249-2292(+)
MEQQQSGKEETKGVVWGDHFHVLVTVTDMALLVVAYGVRNALLQIGLRHVQVMPGGLELSVVEGLRKEHEQQQQRQDGGKRYGWEPLQLLQIVVVPGCGFNDVDQPLLPAFELYCTGAGLGHYWLGLEKDAADRAVQMPLHMAPLYDIHQTLEKEQDRNDLLVATSFPSFSSLSSSIAESSLKVFAQLHALAVSANITIWPRIMNIWGSGHDMDENNINWQDSFLQEYVLTRSKVVILLSNSDVADDDSFLLALNYLLSLGLCVIADSGHISNEVRNEFDDTVTFMNDFLRGAMKIAYPYLRNHNECEHQANIWVERQQEKNLNGINLVMQSARTHERTFSINSLRV